MPKRKVRFFSLIVAVLASLACPIDSFAQTTHPALSSQSYQIANRLLRFLGLERRPKRPKGRRRGGATQSLCPPTEDQKELIALIPTTNIGLTVAGHPKFWFYVPPAKSGRLWRVEFVLIDENEEDVYATPSDFRLSEQSGIVSFQMPQTLPPLARGKQYHWVFSIICNPNDRSGDITVNGLIERVSMEEEAKLESQLKGVSTPRERVLIYSSAENGLWYDALSTLAKLRLENSQNDAILTDWQTFLESVELGDIRLM